MSPADLYIESPNVTVVTSTDSSNTPEYIQSASYIVMHLLANNFKTYNSTSIFQHIKRNPLIFLRIDYIVLN